MKPEVVGDYEIGYECVRLMLRDGDGAEFYRLSYDITIPTIILGADNANWTGIVGRLLHESFEFTSDRLNCRFYPSGDLAGNDAAWLFVLDHQRFADCCAKVADFITRALADLEKAWKARQRRKNSRSR